MILKTLMLIENDWCQNVYERKIKMNILSNSIIQDLIQNVYKGVTETFNYLLERYNSNDVFAYSLYIDDYCSYLGWAANTISHYEIEKLNCPKEEHPFSKRY